MSFFKKAVRNKIPLKMALDGPAGSGKAQPLYSKVLTPDGWREMGELAIGDDLISPNGAWTKITAIHPRGTREIFRVTFSDGAWTECCDEHLWLTTTVLDRNSGSATRRAGSVRPLAEIRQAILDKSGKKNHYVPIVRPVMYGKSEPLPIDPYLMGMLLGNGHFGDHSILFSSYDVELQHAVKTTIPEGVYLRPSNGEGDGLNFAIRRTNEGGNNPLLDKIRALGLGGHRTRQKFIPDIYLRASVDDRLALLQGLLDTDGYTNGYTLEFATSSPQIRDGFVSVVRSLGGLATTIARPGDHGDSYRIYPQLPTWLPPFRLARKARRYIPKSKYPPRRAIVSVEPAGRCETQCIAVDSPDHLYVTDDFIVTHNTFTALSILRGVVGPSGRIAAIDTEHGAMLLYANEFQFEHGRLDDHDPRLFVQAIQAAEAAGYDGLIIDSFSHEWMGNGGILEYIDQRSKDIRGNSFAAWKDGTPLHNAVVSAIVKSKLHIVATMRTKTEYKLEENERGKQTPTKIGTAPVQREGTEYEFDIIGRLDDRHILTFTKSRYRGFDGRVIRNPGREVGEQLRVWLAGDDGGSTLSDATAPDLCPAELQADILDLFDKLEVDEDGRTAILSGRGVARVADLTPNQATGIVEKLRLHWKKIEREAQAKQAADDMEAMLSSPGGPTGEPVAGPVAEVVTEAATKPIEAAPEGSPVGGAGETGDTADGPSTFTISDAEKPDSTAKRRTRKSEAGAPAA